MMDLITVSIGIGLAVSLLFSEVFGLAAGGMVVPGYFAMYLNRPVDILLTLGAALGTFSIVHLLSTFVIIYGKRRTVMMILVGFLVRTLIDSMPIALTDAAIGWTTQFSSDPTELAAFEVIGYVIPGLVAIWMDRQGLVETLATLLTAAVVVRLILILIFGAELTL